MRTPAWIFPCVFGVVIVTGCGSSDSGSSTSADSDAASGGAGVDASGSGGSSASGGAASGGGASGGNTGSGGSTGTGGAASSGGASTTDAAGSGDSSSGGTGSDAAGPDGSFLDGGSLGPTVSILHPGAGVDRTVNVEIYFHGTATDPTDGTLSGSALVWTDSLEGQFGTGDPVNWTPTVVGSHTITLRAVDSLGYGATDSITFSIVP